jgi:UDP-GlcNAc3NAcA epimerase
MKILSIVGARPQFIKLSPLCRAFQRWNSSQPVEPIISQIVHTGQHYDPEMSQVFFDQMEIPLPAYNLGVGSGSHASQTAAMMERIEPVLQQEAPDVAVVYGDTNSTLAGALTASKLGIPVAHVEAGLRSYNREMPEEINRIIADRVSTILFCPTSRAVSNLKKEGFAAAFVDLSETEGYPQALGRISGADPLVVQTGDIMYDAFLFNAAAAERSSTILNERGLRTKGYALLTIHRAESTKGAHSLQRIFSFLATCSSDIPLVFPVHPRTKKLMLDSDVLLPEHVQMIPPVGYFDMLVLEKNAAEIFTDSGGVQKEAFFARVPCVTLRTETEWPETVESGWNRLSNDARESIPTCGPNEVNRLFGDGKSADIHLRVLIDFCSLKK